MDAVKACALDPLPFVLKFDEAARARGFVAEPLGQIAGVPLTAYTKHSTDTRPRIYVSSGIHGDEPAAPLALLSMLENEVFDGRANWFLCPLLNPTGFVRATRENETGIDLNRDYRDLVSPEIIAHVQWLSRQPPFDLSLCLHEDWETQGFYLYELNPDARPTLAETMVSAAGLHGAIETSELIDGRPSCAPGIIRPESDPLLRDKWPEAIYLLQNHGRLGYTLETPSTTPMLQRIAMHGAAVRAGLDRFFVSRSCP
ncbi:MAG: M14 family metallocarboxypeptidase [Opitutaceae bacterium]|jgi:hypothetical protein